MFTWLCSGPAAGHWVELVSQLSTPWLSMLIGHCDSVHVKTVKSTLKLGPTYVCALEIGTGDQYDLLSDS